MLTKGIEKRGGYLLFHLILHCNLAFHLAHRNCSINTVTELSLTAQRLGLCVVNVLFVVAVVVVGLSCLGSVQLLK